MNYLIGYAFICFVTCGFVSGIANATPAAPKELHYPYLTLLLIVFAGWCIITYHMWF